jgi:hypothetical protein
MWIINTQRASLLMSQPTTYLFIIKKMGTSPLTGCWADKGQPGLPVGRRYRWAARGPSPDFTSAARLAWALAEGLTPLSSASLLSETEGNDFEFKSPHCQQIV